MDMPQGPDKNPPAGGRKPRNGDVLELRIENLAFGGQGVARHNGLVVMVRRGLPGDLVSARVVRRKKSLLEARVLDVLEESEHRVAPRCAHFEHCGGCSWQHLDYAQQLAWKERQVRDHLERLAGMPDPPVLPIMGMDEPWRYRNKMEYAFSQFTDERLKLGLHAVGRFDLVIDVDDCHLQPHVCNAIRNHVRDAGREAQWAPYHLRRHEGAMRHLVLRSAHGGAEVMAAFSTSDEPFPQAQEIAESLAAQFTEIKSVMHYVNTSLGGAAIQGRGRVLLGADRIVETILGLELEVSAESFMQTNTAQCERLYAELLDACEFTGQETVLDLYTGAGPIALLAARRAGRVVGIESVPAAVENALRNAERNSIANVEFVCAEVEKVLGEVAEKHHADTVLVDPPRMGLHKNALAALIAAAPRQIGYVSCNPSTLARDAMELCAAGYTLRSVRPVDMFPHTYHIECVARFTKD
jgi:23S rRNA (uracil1939-C5)-methyltransferase